MGGRGGGGGGKAGGGKGGGGGGGGGNGGGSREDGGMAQVLRALEQQAKQQQQLLQALQRGGARSGAGKGGGRSTGGGGGSGSRLAQPRDGDWECCHCSFFPNFANRARCYECGRMRQPAAPAGRGGSITAGPVGAGGLRPQLAWGGARLGAADRAPTHRVPGTSAAAPPKPANAAQPAAATVQARPAALLAGGGSAAAAPSIQTETSRNGATAPNVVADADGYVEVVRRGAWRSKNKQAGEAANPVRHTATGPTVGPAGTVGGNNLSAAHGDVEEEGWQMDWEADEEGEGADEDQPGDEEDSATLKQRLEKENAAVRALAREGLAEDHPAMAAAVAARDAVDAAWRSSRKPHPVARRMGWAQRRLDKAMRARDRVRDELAEYDTRAREQRDAILERLGNAMERVAKHREALDVLQEEAAVDAPSARKGNGAAGVCAQLAGGMRTELAPTVEALAAEIPEGSAAHAHLSIIIAKLEGMQGKLEQVGNGTDGYQEYNMSEGDAPSEAEWSESHELGGGPGADADAAKGARQWATKGHGRWCREGAGHAQHSGKGGTARDTDGPVAVPRPATTTTDEHAGAAPPTPTTAQKGTARAARQGDTGPSGKGVDANGDNCTEDQQPPNKSRKGQDPADTAMAHAAAQDTARALQLMESQRTAAAAGEYGSQAAIQAAGQLHARNVAQVVSAAIERGIQPITETGEELIMLGPQELEEWTAKHMPDGKGQFW